MDQAHEQINAIVKRFGGATGLSENLAEFRRWIVCSPEFAWLSREV